MENDQIGYITTWGQMGRGSLVGFGCRSLQFEKWVCYNSPPPLRITIIYEFSHFFYRPNNFMIIILVYIVIYIHNTQEQKQIFSN